MTIFLYSCDILYMFTHELKSTMKLAVCLKSLNFTASYTTGGRNVR